MAVRVLHIHSAMGVGGMETCLLRLLACLPRDITSDVYLVQRGGALEPRLAELGVGVLPRDVPGGTKLHRFGSLVGEIRRRSPDIIHAYMENTASLALLAKLAARSRAAVIVHWVSGKPYLRRGRWPYYLHRLLVSLADTVVCGSEGVRAAYLPYYPSAAHVPIRVVHFGIDLEEVDRLVLHAPERDGRCPAVCDGSIVIAFVGRLIDAKGVDILIRAVEVLPRTIARMIRVVIVGDGPARSALEAAAADLKSPTALAFTGFLPPEDVLRLLSTADILAHPARWEALGGSILEAMAVGLPVIATAVGGIPEAVEDGVNGLLIPPEDPQALAEAIGWMLDHPEERKRMGQAGRRLVHERFDMRVTAAQLADIYRELAAGSRSRREG